MEINLENKETNNSDNIDAFIASMAALVREEDIGGETTSEPQPTPSSGRRKEAKPLYSPGVGAIKVAVVFDNYPTKLMTQDVAYKIMLRLMRKLVKLDPTKLAIHFSGHSLRNGGLVVSCEDVQSKDWLVRNIAQCSPWEGVPLRVCDPIQLKGYRRIATFIPNPVDDVKCCLELIGVQNRGFKMNCWKVLGSKKTSKGLYIVASIPFSQFALLETAGFCLFHGFDMAEVKPLGFCGISTRAVEMEVEEEPLTVAASGSSVAQEEARQLASGSHTHHTTNNEEKTAEEILEEENCMHC